MLWFLLDKEQSSGHALKPRILIVDDEHDITFPWKLGLERLGFQVDTFNNPILAASTYQPNMYDLLLIDIRMPMMDGFELYKEIRKIDKKVKLCFVTAYDINNEDFKKSFPTMTLRHFIKKPIKTQDLAKEIRQKLNEDFEIIS